MSLLKRLLNRGPSGPTPEAFVPRWPDLHQTAFALWGGILDDVALNLRSGTVLLSTHVVSGGIEKHAVIECREITETSIKNAIKWPWAYAEITEVWAVKTADRTRLVITLWAEPSELAIEARAITIGGQPIQSPYDAVARTLA